MSLDDLRGQFVVDDDVRNEKLEELINRMLPHCVVRKNGSVELKRSGLAGKQRVKLVLAARLLASKLDDAIAEEVAVEQISDYTGLPKDQAAARAKECLDRNGSLSEAPGCSYKARILKVEEFLSGLAEAHNFKRIR